MQLDPSRYWYRDSLNWLTFLLLPLSWLYSLVITVRRWFYQSGLFRIQRFSVPVIVVGNITLGGTGKTPLVIWLAQYLHSLGYHPGIVSRGVGGKRHVIPMLVTEHAQADIVGDEALLLAQHAHCPVMLAVDRSAAVRELLKTNTCNIVISDDGLQHYRLARDMEIIVVDGVRQLGNRQLLPAGPLREPVEKINRADFVVVNGGTFNGGFSMSLEGMELVALSSQHRRITLADFPRGQIHAIAGIGHPQRFFNMLAQYGFDVIPHAFPDHYAYQPRDLLFNDELPVVMTEKDAVKCMSFVKDNYWYLPVTAKLDVAFQQKLANQLTRMEKSHDTETSAGKHFNRIDEQRDIRR